MKQPKSLFFGYPRRPDLLARGGVILVIAVLMASLSACAGPQKQAGATSTVNHQPGITASPTRVLKPVGPDAGLYIAYSGSAGNPNGNALYKIDYQSGQVLWKHQFKLSHPDSNGNNDAAPDDLIVQQGLAIVTSANTVDGGTYVPMVYAVAAATGQQVWSYAFDSSVELIRGQITLPVISQGFYYITGVKEKNPDGDLLYALDARTGKLLQTYHTVRGFAIQNNILYSSDLDSGPIRALNLATNQVLWEKRIGTNGQVLLDPTLAGEYFEAPLVLQNRVYFRASDQVSDQNQISLYAFDAKSGQLVFHSPVVTTPGSVEDVPVSDEMAVSGVTGDSLSAWNAANGQVLWSRKMGFAGTFVVSGKSIYATLTPDPVNASSGNAPVVSDIVSLDAATGAPIWQKTVTSLLAGNPSVTGLLVQQDVLYINQMIGQNYRTTAIEMNGKVLWQVNLGGHDSEVLIP